MLSLVVESECALAARLVLAELCEGSFPDGPAKPISLPPFRSWRLRMAFSGTPPPTRVPEFLPAPHLLLDRSPWPVRNTSSRHPPQ
jgi:hypothetical protein